MCSEWFELVEKAKLSDGQTEQLTVAAQAQFKVINQVHTIVWNNYIGPMAYQKGALWSSVMITILYVVHHFLYF